MNSKEELNKIRDRIIDAANNGYTEAINDMKYFDKPLSRLIEARERAAEAEWFAKGYGAAQERILNELEEWAEPLFDRAGSNANAIGAIPISVIKAKRQSLKEKES